MWLRGISASIPALLVIIVGIIFIVVVTSNSSTTTSAAFATALSPSDFNPEGVYITHGDKAGMDVLCDWINICVDNGRIDSTHEFCTEDAIRNIPYLPGGCPELLVRAAVTFQFMS